MCQFQFNIDISAIMIYIIWLPVMKPWRIWVNWSVHCHNNTQQNLNHVHNSWDVIINMMSHECHIVLYLRPFDCLFNSICGPIWTKHLSLCYCPFVRWIHLWLVNSLHKGPIMWKKLIRMYTCFTLTHPNYCSYNSEWPILDRYNHCLKFPALDILSEA